MSFRTVISFILVGTAMLVGAQLNASAADGPTPRFQAECERHLPPTAIKVVAYPSDVIYDFSYGINSLTQKATPSRIPNHYTVGLTDSNFKLEVSTAGDALQDTMTKMLCIRPQLTISVQVGPQVVYVAKEFPKDTCAFWEIAEHELRHVKTNQHQAEKVAAELERELKASFGNRVIYGHPGDLREALAKNLKDEWLPWGQAKFQAVKTEHQAIDSPQEYARTTTMCGGVVAEAIRRLR